MTRKELLKTYGLLENYASLSVDTDIEAVEKRVDIDSAMKKLTVLERFVVVTTLMGGWEIGICARWTGKDAGVIRKVQTTAVNKLHKYIQRRAK
jgi:hypothetical protein